MAQTRKAVSLTAAGALIAAMFSLTTIGGDAQAQSLPATPGYSLPLALQESLYFYDAQKSGPARTAGDQPLSWRDDDDPTDSCVPLQPMANNVGTNLSTAFIAANKSVLDPKSTGCLNLSGGFHDAGDTVKFGLPQTYAAGVLGWGMYEFPQAYTATGTWNHAMDEMKWFTDYFLRSTFLSTSGQVVAFAYQVGSGSVDHSYWGPSELESPTQFPRPAWLATTLQRLPGQGCLGRGLAVHRHRDLQLPQRHPLHRLGRELHRLPQGDHRQHHEPVAEHLGDELGHPLGRRLLTD